MVRWFYKKYLPYLLVFVFFCCVIFSPQDIYGQGFYKITDKIGGSGSSTAQTGENDSNSSTLIIVGAAIIAGFLVYKLVIDKDKSTTKDSTSKSETLLNRKINLTINKIDPQFEKYLQMPVNFYAGIQRTDILVSERKVILGISYNF